MAASTYADSLTAVLRWEGGYSDHPDDNGGATKFGVTIRTLHAWRGNPVTKSDVKSLGLAEAKAIYRAWYWQPVRGDDLPAGVDLAVFDIAVNSGPSRAARFLQSALNVTQDGKIGPATIAAAKLADPEHIVEAICASRLHWLRGLSDWPVFGRGWANRVNDIRATALTMCTEQKTDAQQAPTGGGIISAIMALIRVILTSILGVKK